MALPRILLVEDEEHTRARLARALSGDSRLSLAGAEASYAGGRAALERERPDVLITDLELSDGNGLDLIRAIDELGLPTLGMVITVFGDEKTVIAALEAGALGYLLKDGSTDYLVRSTLELLQNGSPISPAIARHVLRRLRDAPPAADHRAAPSAPDEDAPSLSDREREVLEFLVKGFTYAEIAGFLSVTPHTVATHVRRLYRKLAVRSRAEAVYEALASGIVTVEK